MLESLGPVVTLFKLILEGLTKATKTIKSTKKKALQRKIIEIQLSLEDIIDNAQEILSIFEYISHKTKVNENTLRNLEGLLYRQYDRIYILMEQINDHGSEEIMKLFAPDIRRNIINLIHIKGGFIQEVIRTFSLFKNIRISKNQIIGSVEPALLDWNHDRFIIEGLSYVRTLQESYKTSDVVISERLSDQRQVVDDLVECSKRLSEFIKTQIGIEEFFGLKT